MHTFNTGAAPSNKARQLCVKREQLAPTSPRMRDAVQDVLVVGGATTLTKCPCGGWRAAALDSTMYDNLIIMIYKFSHCIV